MGRNKEALELGRDTIAFDPLDLWSRNELVALSTALHFSGSHDARIRSLLLETHVCLDIASDYADAGLWREAIDLLERHLAALSKQQEPYPMVLYSLGYFCDKSGERDKAREYCRKAAHASADYCFPARIEEMLVLQSAIRTNPSHSKPPYYLGNLFYNKRHRNKTLPFSQCY